MLISATSFNISITTIILVFTSSLFQELTLIKIVLKLSHRYLHSTYEVYTSEEEFWELSRTC